jgi:hypothetical protein
MDSALYSRIKSTRYDALPRACTFCSFLHMFNHNVQSQRVGREGISRRHGLIRTAVILPFSIKFLSCCSRQTSCDEHGFVRGGGGCSNGGCGPTDPPRLPRPKRPCKDRNHGFRRSCNLLLLFLPFHDGPRTRNIRSVLNTMSSKSGMMSRLVRCQTN